MIGGKNCVYCGGLGFGCVYCVLASFPKPTVETVAQDERGWYPLNAVDGPRFKTKFAALLQAAALPNGKSQ